jgi:hypothetical protein
MLRMWLALTKETETQSQAFSLPELRPSMDHNVNAARNILKSGLEQSLVETNPPTYRIDKQVSFKGSKKIMNLFVSSSRMRVSVEIPLTGSPELSLFSKDAQGLAHLSARKVFSCHLM